MDSLSKKKNSSYMENCAIGLHGYTFGVMAIGTSPIALTSISHCRMTTPWKVQHSPGFIRQWLGLKVNVLHHITLGNG